jgi:hypothetical protein
MALDGTYAGLKASVADWLNRADLTAAVPDFITLAEGQMNRRLRVRRMVGVATATISAAYETLPGDFAGALALTLSDGRQLDFLTPDALAQKRFLRQPGAAEPSHYSVVGTQLQFYPDPDQDYTALLTYYRMLPPLAAAGANWLLTCAPDAYLYGALTQASPYLKDDARIPVWGELFTAALSDLEAADRRESHATRLTPQPTLVV